jgi:hypothetical protein
VVKQQSIVTLPELMQRMPSLSDWDVSDLTRGWFRVISDGLTAWRLNSQLYLVTPATTNAATDQQPL